MLATIDPRRAAETVREAALAVRSAWYEAALDLLEGCPDWPAPYAGHGVLLKAEILGKRSAPDALAFLSGMADLYAGDAKERFAYEVAMGKAFANARDFASAEVRYRVAEPLARHAEHGTHTLAYHRSRLLWMSGRFDPAAPEVERSVAHPDPNAAAAALAVRAWHHGSLGEFGAQISDFRRALAKMDVPADLPVDVSTLAVTCHSLARLAFETADGAAIEDARIAFERIAWSPGVAVDRFQTLRSLGWDAFMRGHPGRAQWLFKDARDAAPSDAWRVMGHLDRAFVARIARNEPWAVEELAAADLLAHDVRWESTFGEERLALVTLAILLAHSNPSRAQRYAAMWSQLGTENVNPTLALAQDRRGHGFARYAQGRIDQMLGNVEAASAALQTSYELFDAIGYHFQSAIAAMALEELTNDAGWRERAVRHSRAYPDCPLLSIAQTPPHDPFPADVTALGRQLARAYAEGATTDELSRRFSRSRYTIDVQLSGLARAFGVGSNEALLDELRKLELVR